MSIRLIAIFSLGASVGYAAHRPGAAATASTTASTTALHDEPGGQAARAVREAPAPPPRVIIVAAPVPTETTEPEVQGEVAQEGEAAAPAPDPDVPRGVLQGKVVDREGDAVYGATVTIESVLGGRQSTRSDGDGAYRFDGLPSAAYKVHFRRYGTEDEDRDVGVNQLDPTELDVTMTRDE